MNFLPDVATEEYQDIPGWAVFVSMLCAGGLVYVCYLMATAVGN